MKTLDDYLPGFTLVLGSHDDQRLSTLIAKSRIELTEGWISVFVRPPLLLLLTCSPSQFPSGNLGCLPGPFLFSGPQTPCHHKLPRVLPDFFLSYMYLSFSAQLHLVINRYFSEEHCIECWLSSMLPFSPWSC